MFEQNEHEFVGLQAPAETLEAEQAPMSAAPVSTQSHDGVVASNGNDWHADAGRKGAYRIRELIQFGKLYEQEHGLKSGRQRLRQLIEEGKQYELDHGLRPAPERASRRRGPRMSKQQLLSTFLHSVVRLAKPSLRAELTRLLDELDKKPV
ncbi:MAG TPA: hypothetical protein VFA18_18680 [Gemmataceae bacterium]|nr:hypothetical protein [Gemmataceae bacterium]